MMIMASSSEVTATIQELEQKGILIIGIIVVLAIFLGYILSTSPGETICQGNESNRRPDRRISE